MKDIQHTYKQHMNPFSRMDVHDGVMGLGMCCCWCGPCPILSCGLCELHQKHERNTYLCMVRRHPPRLMGHEKLHLALAPSKAVQDCVRPIASELEVRLLER